jgi:hypothetical protein
MTIFLNPVRWHIYLYVLVLVTSPVLAAWQVSESKLTISGAAAGNNFGRSVAVDGNTAIIGVSGLGLGFAYIYIRNENTWVQQAKLTLPDGAQNKRFGWSVDISGDTAVVGTLNNRTEQGAAYVFVRNGTSWALQGKLLGFAPADQYDHFGLSVAIDGDTVAVGADWDGDGGLGSGAVYLYYRSAGTWSELVKIKAADIVKWEGFGRSIDISGGTVVIGAHKNSENKKEAGAVYIFTGSGANWVQEAKLTASDAQIKAAFGRSVAISGDSIVVGARGTSQAGYSSGSAYIFTRTGTTWVEQATLLAADADSRDYLGQSVAIDGDIAVAGAFGDDDAGESSGSAYVFSRSGVDWVQQAKLTAFDAEAGDEFGRSVAIYGNTIALGAEKKADAGASSGAGYMATLNPKGNGKIIIDGNFDDWVNKLVFTDATNDGNTVNWEQVWINGDDGVLSFFYSNIGDINQKQLYLWNIYLDTDKQSSTGYNFELLGADYLLQGKNLYQYTGTGQDWSWTYLKEVEYAVNGARAELSIEKPAIGLTTDANTYSALFYGTDSDGSNIDYLLIDVTGIGGSVIMEEIAIPEAGG